MRLVDGAVDLLLRIAGRRWPADLRTPMLREWTAELAAIRADTRRNPLVRAARQLRFATSLAGSSPVEDENGVPRGWRELLADTGHALRPVLMLLGVALLCELLSEVLPGTGAMVLLRFRGDRVPGGFSDGGIAWAANAVSLGCLAAAVGIAAWLGGWIGRRLPVAWAHRTRLGAAGSAVLAPVVIGAGAFVELAVWRAQLPSGAGMTTLAAEPMPAIPLWVVLTVPLAAATVRLANRGRRWAVPLAVVAGALAVLELTAIAAGRSAAAMEQLDFATSPAWFPLSLLDPYGSGIRFGHIEQGSVASETVVGIVADVVRPLLVATAFVLRYALTASRAPLAGAPRQLGPQRSAPVSGRPVPAVGTSALHRSGTAVTAVGLALWAYTLTLLTPALADVAKVDEMQSWELHLFAQELREAGILLTVLGLVVAAAARGPVLLPSLFAAAAMVTLDSVVDAAGIGGPAATAGVFAVGTAVVGAGWWASGALAGHRRGADEPAVRRTLAEVAVVAALCAPALFSHLMEPGLITPIGFPAGTATAVGFLAAVAGVAAVAARPGRLPVAVSLPAVGLPALLLATGGAFAAGAPGWLGSVALLGPLFATGAVAVMTLRLRWRSIALWVLVGLPAAVFGLPVAYFQLVPAHLVGLPLIRAAGYGNPPDGLPFLPGAVIVSLPLAVLVGFLVAPRTAPAVAPGPHGLAADGLPDPAA